MERKIGEEFNFLGYTLKTEKSKSGACFGCFFYKHSLACYLKQTEDIKGTCVRDLRSDDNHVIFKEQ